jgi:hypothetical protein
LLLFTAEAVQAASPVPIGFNGLIANARPGGNNAKDLFTDTFTYGTPIIQEGDLGEYGSFIFIDNTSTGGSGINTNYNLNSIAPADNFIDSFPGGPFDVDVDISSDYFPIIDRMVGGSVFDPAEYQLEVEYRPYFSGMTNFNVAPFFNIILEQHDGFVEDNAGYGKRAGEQIGYQVGGVDEGQQTINDIWATQTGSDPGQFATYTVPITSPTFVQRAFMFHYGDGTFRTDHVLPGGGLDGGGADVTDGADFGDFEGTALAGPNGAVQIHVQSAQQGEFEGDLLGVEIRSVRVVRTNPTPGLVARMDGESGISVRFGNGLLNTEQDVTIPGDGNLYQPNATNQMSRFDETSMTNLFIQTDSDAESSVFGSWQEYVSQTFDGTDATVELRARLNSPLDETKSETLTVTLKDLDGNDDAPGQGAEEWTSNFDLTALNTSTFTTLSVPLNSFSRAATADQFDNEGDNSIEDFNLYYLGGFIGADSGLVDLEIEYLQVVLPVTGLAGDYNGNDVIDAADYTTWRDAVTAGATVLLNDPTPGTVDESDFAYWRTHFGETLGAGSGAGAAAAAVPEPASAVLALLAVGLAVFRRRRGAC